MALHHTWTSPDTGVEVVMRAPDYLRIFDLLEAHVEAARSAEGKPSRSATRYRVLLAAYEPVFSEVLQSPAPGDKPLVALQEAGLTFVEVVQLGTEVLRWLHEEVAFVAVVEEEAQEAVPFSAPPEEGSST